MYFVVWNLYLFEQLAEMQWYWKKKKDFQGHMRFVTIIWRRCISYWLAKFPAMVTKAGDRLLVAPHNASRNTTDCGLVQGQKYDTVTCQYKDTELKQMHNECNYYYVLPPFL